jgi:hypothetical protein
MRFYFVHSLSRLETHALPTNRFQNVRRPIEAKCGFRKIWRLPAGVVSTTIMRTLAAIAVQRWRLMNGNHFMVCQPIDEESSEYGGTQACVLIILHLVT